MPTLSAPGLLAGQGIQLGGAFGVAADACAPCHPTRSGCRRQRRNRCTLCSSAPAWTRPTSHTGRFRLEHFRNRYFLRLPGCGGGPRTYQLPSAGAYREQDLLTPAWRHPVQRQTPPASFKTPAGWGERVSHLGMPRAESRSVRPGRLITQLKSKERTC